jgi:hypothetical protein
MTASEVKVELVSMITPTAPQLVEGPPGLGQCPLEVGQGKRGEESEPVRVVLHHLGAEVVDLGRQPAGRMVVPEMDPGRGDGKHRPSDALTVHHGQLVTDGQPGMPSGF